MVGTTLKSEYKRKWSEETLRAALDNEDFKARRLSLSKLSKLYGIPKSTLSRYVKKELHVGARSGARVVLTVEEENMIAERLREISKLGIRKTNDQVCDFVKTFLDSNNRVTIFKNNRPHKDWWYSFLKRHPDIRGERMGRKKEPKQSSLTTSLGALESTIAKAKLVTYNMWLRKGYGIQGNCLYDAWKSLKEGEEQERRKLPASKRKSAGSEELVLPQMTNPRDITQALQNEDLIQQESPFSVISELTLVLNEAMDDQEIDFNYYHFKKEEKKYGL